MLNLQNISHGFWKVATNLENSKENLVDLEHAEKWMFTSKSRRWYSRERALRSLNFLPASYPWVKNTLVTTFAPCKHFENKYNVLASKNEMSGFIWNACWQSLKLIWAMFQGNGRLKHSKTSEINRLGVVNDRKFVQKRLQLFVL